MPWKTVGFMDQRMRLVLDYRSGDYTVADLARHYGVSRRTVYKWIDRYEEEGLDGLKDRSRAPARPARTSPDIEKAILAMKARYPDWGAPKLLTLLKERSPRRRWPAQSTVGDILKRHGLTAPRKRRRRAEPNAEPLAHCREANDVWSADFKGWFLTGDGVRCIPLTITDNHSRFILRCQGMRGATGYEAVKPLFEATFRQYGLPRAIRTDNGPPFASVALGGLSPLSVWWLRLGIRPERIRPGAPQENGRHERMHKTLKAEAIRPPRENERAQQRAFDRFVRRFNFERPHQALGQQTPATHYAPSPRPWSARAPEEPTYPNHWPTRAVSPGGQMRWGGRKQFVTQALIGQRIGLEPDGDGLWIVHFGPMAIGRFDERRRRITRLSAEEKKNRQRLGGGAPPPKSSP